MSHINHLEEQIDLLIARYQQLEHENARLQQDNHILQKKTQQLEQSCINLQQRTHEAVNRLTFIVSDLKEEQSELWMK